MNRTEPAGPAFAGTDEAWRTSDEMSFIENLGHHTEGLSTPAGRRLLLHGYLVALKLRVVRGSVDWRAVETHARGLLNAVEYL